MTRRPLMHFDRKIARPPSTENMQRKNRNLEGTCETPQLNRTGNYLWPDITSLESNNFDSKVWRKQNGSAQWDRPTCFTDVESRTVSTDPGHGTTFYVGRLPE